MKHRRDITDDALRRLIADITDAIDRMTGALPPFKTPVARVSCLRGLLETARCTDQDHVGEDGERRARLAMEMRALYDATERAEDTIVTLGRFVPLNFKDCGGAA